jgi:hypothetical protein
MEPRGRERHGSRPEGQGFGRKGVNALPSENARLFCPMPELAEVEWYRKQWNAGLGNPIVDLALHARKRVFRGTDTHALRRHLVGQKLQRSTTRGKRMLFKFSDDNWLGIHLGMTGTLRVEAPDYRAEKHDHLVLYQTERALVFRDSRQFGRIRFHHGPDEPDWWKSNVPEIVSTRFTREFVLRSTSQGADQSSVALAERFLRNRKLDGRRNLMARKDLAVTSGRKTQRRKTRRAFARNKIRREKIVTDSGPRLFRSAAHLADSSTLEVDWSLSNSPDPAQARDYRWANNRLVPAVPALAQSKRLRILFRLANRIPL